MGKVAADNIHKWVYREAQEQGISLLSPWPGSLDPHPRTWEGQFKAGIQVRCSNLLGAVSRSTDHLRDRLELCSSCSSTLL
jgi:hypothetical protein